MLLNLLYKYILIPLFLFCIFEPSIVYAIHNFKYHSIAHQVLSLESRELGIQPNYRLLDEIIDEVRQRKNNLQLKFYSEDDAVELLKIIDDILLNKNFIYDGRICLLSEALESRRLNQDEIQYIRHLDIKNSGIDFRNKEEYNRIILPDNRHKIHVLKNIHENFHFAECVTFSFIYLGIADVLNLPIYMVLAPSHVFVRWHLKNSYFNWETTSGTIVDDDYIRNVFDISELSIRSGVYLKSLNRTESFVTAYYMLSNSVNQADKKIFYLTKTVELNPKHSRAYYNRGTLWYQKGQFQQALKDFNMAIGLDPNHSETFNNRGNIWYETGKTENALSDYNQAIMLNPKHSRAYNNRGNIWYQKGFFDKALTDYNNAIALDPAFSGAYNNRGNVLYQKGIYKEALADYNKAIELDPNNKDAYKNRLEVLKKLGNRD